MRRIIIMSKFIYMDNAATTAVRQEVVDAMVPYLQNHTLIHQVYIVLHRRLRMIWKKQEKL